MDTSKRGRPDLFELQISEVEQVSRSTTEKTPENLLGDRYRLDSEEAILIERLAQTAENSR